MFDPEYMKAAMSHAPNFFAEVRNPEWSDETKTKINCEVNFNHVQFEEWTNFCADPTDHMPYSKDIFDRAVAGEFGPIKDAPLVVVPEPYTPEQLAYFAKKREQELAAISGQIPRTIL